MCYTVQRPRPSITADMSFITKNYNIRYKNQADCGIYKKHPFYRNTGVMDVVKCDFYSLLLLLLISIIILTGFINEFNKNYCIAITFPMRHIYVLLFIGCPNIVIVCYWVKSNFCAPGSEINKCVRCVSNQRPVCSRWRSGSRTVAWSGGTPRSASCSRLAAPGSRPSPTRTTPTRTCPTRRWTATSCLHRPMTTSTGPRPHTRPSPGASGSTPSPPRTRPTSTTAIPAPPTRRSTSHDLYRDGAGLRTGGGGEGDDDFW